MVGGGGGAYLDARVPESLAHAHPLLQHTREALTAKGHHVGIDLAAAEGFSALLPLETGLGDGEDTVHTEGHTHTGNLRLGQEHAHQVVIATSCGDTADTQGRVVGAVVILQIAALGLALLAGLLHGLGLRCGGRHGGGGALGNDLIDHTGVIIETAGQAHVEGDLVQHTECLEVIHKQAHIFQTGLGRLVGSQALILEEVIKEFATALVHHVCLDLVSHGAVQALLLDHFLAHVRPGHLVQLVDGTGDGTDLLLGHTADLEHTVQNLPVVDLDVIAAVPAQLLEDFGDDAQDLGIGDHGIEGTGDIEIALVELAHATLAHGGLIATVHLGDVVALHAADIRVHGEPAGEGDGEIVAERADFSTLVLKVVNELGVLAILTGENLAQLEDGGVEGSTAMALEDIGDGGEDAVAEEGVGAGPVLGTLGGFEVEGELGFLFFGHGGERTRGMGRENGGGGGGKSRVGEGDVVVAVVGDGGGFDRLPDVWPLAGLVLLKATAAGAAGAGAASATARWGPGTLRQGSSGGAEDAWLE